MLCNDPKNGKVYHANPVAPTQTQGIHKREAEAAMLILLAWLDNKELPEAVKKALATLDSFVETR